MTLHGDCLVELRGLGDNSVDALVTDPPYGLSDHRPGEVEACMTAWLAGKPYVPKGKGFMGADWDGWVPGPECWRECYRVLKPGGYLLAFAGSRTSDLMSMALRLSGFRKHPEIYWAYGSGFPKASNLGKAVDKFQGNEREEYLSSIAKPDSDCWGIPNNKSTGEVKNPSSYNIKTENIAVQGGMRKHTKGTSEWEGWYYGLQSLKPAVEPVLMFQKPPEGGMVENVLKWGTGGVNINGCKVACENKTPFPVGNYGDRGIYGADGERTADPNPTGRFPSHLILDGSDEVEKCFPETGKSTGGRSFQTTSDKYGEYANKFSKEDPGFGDSGSASRFFQKCPYDTEDIENYKRVIYQAKAGKKDRNEGCEGLEEKQYSCDGRKKETEGPHQRNNSQACNFHPTCKPTALMRILARLVTPPGGIILDPFMGSGTTGKAAVLENFSFIGIEQDAEYIKIARARIEHAEKQKGGRLF